MYASISEERSSVYPDLSSVFDLTNIVHKYVWQTASSTYFEAATCQFHLMAITILLAQN